LELGPDTSLTWSYQDANDLANTGIYWSIMFITLLNSIIPSDLVNAEGKLGDTCKKAGFRLRYRMLTAADIMDHMQQPAINFSASLSGEAQRNLYLHHRDQL
jgi:hypothetical protein